MARPFPANRQPAEAPWEEDLVSARFAAVSQLRNIQEIMNRSAEWILTSHVGSLSRPSNFFERYRKGASRDVWAT